MEEYLRYGLLSLAGLIVLLIVLEYWLRHRRLKLIERTTMLSTEKDILFKPSSQDDFSTSSCQFHLSETEEPIDILPKPIAKKYDNNLLVLNIFAKPNHHFASYDLLQAITAAGMQYGEMNIFHYQITTDNGRETLFSLASATKPGTFHLDNIGELSCVGLTLFSDLSNATNPKLVWEKMFEIAESLAEDLDGVLHSDQRKLWDNTNAEQYQQKVDYYCHQS